MKKFKACENNNNNNNNLISKKINIIVIIIINTFRYVFTNTGAGMIAAEDTYDVEKVREEVTSQGEAQWEGISSIIH